MADANVPVTKIRLRIPRGAKVKDIIEHLEISFEEVEPTGAEFNRNVCCVDAAVVSPVSTVSHH